MTVFGINHYLEFIIENVIFQMMIFIIQQEIACFKQADMAVGSILGPQPASEARGKKNTAPTNPREKKSLNICSFIHIKEVRFVQNVSVSLKLST
jgi:hypothetical protein